ncbi:hypothetical protein BC941DRAFT_416792 [Chlamydoabsidia padenii]|nr:hypothetical protein BC941DRAFT_416792 [Chlamydoabsidia padenii]
MLDSTADTDDDVHRAYTDSEFRMEMLGFDPNDILDKLYNTHSIAFYQLLEGFKQYLMTSCKLETSKKEALFDKFFHPYETQLETVFDKCFSAFQQYFIDSVLEIPADPEIVPLHYKGLDMGLTAEHMEKLDKELKDAQNGVMSQRAFQHFIKREEKRCDTLLRTQKEYIKQLEFIPTILKENNITNLDSALENVKEQFGQLDERMRKRLDEVFRRKLLNEPEGYTLDSKTYIDKYLIKNNLNKQS